jgi:hypothetical protein
VSRRNRERLRNWAEQVIADSGPGVARLIGVRPPLPPVRVDVDPGGRGPASTSGTTISLGERWFAEHPDDVGCILHELAHAFMRAPRYAEDTIWLIEGIGDYVRDVLGYEATWTSAHHEPGKATAGYQTTAHFLLWLETRRPGAVVELSRRLSAGTYDVEAFGEVADRPLADLVRMYEAAQAALA